GPPRELRELTIAPKSVSMLHRWRSLARPGDELKTRILLKIFLVLLAWPGLAGASSANALKRYEAGKYDLALREYKRLLLETPDDPRLHFNAGAAAFQAKDFEQARSQLKAALVTQDLQLQERTYYNLGNTE